MQNRFAALLIAVLLSGFQTPAGVAWAQERMVDLTQVIQPTAPDAQRKFVVRIHDALQEIPGKVRPEGEWYVMSDVDLMGHVGTHIEAPFHCLKKGADLSQIPLDRLFGAALGLDFLKAHAEGGGAPQAGGGGGTR